MVARQLQATMSADAPKATALSKAEKKQRFEDAFNVIRDDLLEHFSGQGMPEEGVEWYKRVSPSHTLGSSSISVALAPPYMELS